MVYLRLLSLSGLSRHQRLALLVHGRPLWPEHPWPPCRHPLLLRAARCTARPRGSGDACYGAVCRRPTCPLPGPSGRVVSASPRVPASRTPVLVTNKQTQVTARWQPWVSFVGPGGWRGAETSGAFFSVRAPGVMLLRQVPDTCHILTKVCQGIQMTGCDTENSLLGVECRAVREASCTFQRLPQPKIYTVYNHVLFRGILQGSTGCILGSTPSILISSSGGLCVPFLST